MIGIPESLAREPPESPQKLLPVGPTRAPQLPVRSAGVDSADRANATVPLQNLLAKITVAAEARAQAGWMSVSRPPAPASVARNDARIGERAATHGRSATEGSDEHGGVKRAPSVRAPASRTASHGENLDVFGGSAYAATGRRERHAAHRRTRRRAGAAQRNVAMSELG
jgi:hypothetical protein